jgi:hypothetical protein
MLSIIDNRMQFIEPEPYCYVCGRCTEHFGEHDDLIDLGLAVYNYRRGSVEATDVFYSIQGQVERAMLHRLWPQLWGAESDGKVSLLKPVGEVITSRYHGGVLRENMRQQVMQREDYQDLGLAKSSDSRVYAMASDFDGEAW